MTDNSKLKLAWGVHPTNHPFSSLLQYVSKSLLHRDKCYKINKNISYNNENLYDMYAELGASDVLSVTSKTLW